MASKPRHLTERERAEVVGLLRPLVDRFTDRFGVPVSAVLSAVREALPERRAPALPANYVPSNPVVAKLVAGASALANLSPASIAEDAFEAAQTARDAVIYAARAWFGLSYETIGASLGGLGHEAVMDGYCRAIGRLENADKGFERFAKSLVEPFRKRAA